MKCSLLEDVNGARCQQSDYQKRYHGLRHHENFRPPRTEVSLWTGSDWMSSASDPIIAAVTTPFKNITQHLIEDMKGVFVFVRLTHGVFYQDALDLAPVRATRGPTNTSLTIIRLHIDSGKNQRQISTRFRH
jgi:hypothetical protein